jgi:hypothetical protein
MPFTLFHLGPALAIGLPLRKYVHVPTFIVANVILDVEPLLVMVFGLNYPLHGYLHTLLFAFMVGLLLAFVMFKLEGTMQPAYKWLLLETSNSYSVRAFILAGISGTMLHVLLDAPLYSDIHPFFPFTANPLLETGALAGMDILVLCIWMGIFALIFYAALVVFHAYKNFTSRKHTP